MKSRQSRVQSHRMRCTAVIAAGMLVGQSAACMTPQETEQRELPPAHEVTPEAPPLSSQSSPLTGVDRAIASLLNISQTMGADSNCTPAARGGMSDGITAITASYNSQANVDNFALSNEVLWITGHLPGSGGVISCGYTRLTPDPADPYLGWRRSAMVSPPFELQMPCAVAVPFQPSEQLPWEMLAAFAAGPDLEECTGTPPPIDPEDPPPGGEDPPPGGEDPPPGGPGGPPPPPPPPGGPILGDSIPAFPAQAAISVSLPHVTMTAQPWPLDRQAASLEAATQQIIDQLIAEAPEVADDIARLRANMPSTIEAIRDSGRYAHLAPMERIRAELSEATALLLPDVTSPPASKDGSAPISIQTGGTHCVPCVGYMLLFVGELLAAIAYISKAARAKNADEKFEAWFTLAGIFCVVVGTTVVAAWYCSTCPPVMALWGYAAVLITRLTQMAFHTFICVASTILGTPVCI